jgi:hypothetical protein
MSFRIDFLQSEVPSEKQNGLIYGQIKIGGFSEKFSSSLDFWSVADYKNHWRKAIGRILARNSKSALITSIDNPTSSNFYIWWPMYLLGEKVYVQNQLLFLDQLHEPFDLENPFKYVPSRQTHNEDGEKISEWVVDFSDLTAT